MADGSTVITEHETSILRLRLVAPPPDLMPFVSGYYRTEVKPGQMAEDWLPPEEANIRVGNAEEYVAGPSEKMRNVPFAIVSGPTNRATRLRIRHGKFWGVGFTPAGWTRIVGLPASDFANRFEDVAKTRMPIPLGSLLGRLGGDGDDIEKCARDINDTLRLLLGDAPESENTIISTHRALVSHDRKTAAQHAEMAGMTVRTFERFCKRHFGFTPGALLRRQRFLRSLAQYMIDPSMRWIDSVDSHYCDQAHFVREFRATMGMTPSRYAKLPNPITKAAVVVIMTNADVALQALYHPDNLRRRASGV